MLPLVTDNSHLLHTPHSSLLSRGPAHHMWHCDKYNDCQHCAQLSLFMFLCLKFECSQLFLLPHVNRDQTLRNKCKVFRKHIHTVFLCIKTAGISPSPTPSPPAPCATESGDHLDVRCLVIMLLFCVHCPQQPWPQKHPWLTTKQKQRQSQF